MHTCQLKNGTLRSVAARAFTGHRQIYNKMNSVNTCKVARPWLSTALHSYNLQHSIFRKIWKIV